MVMFRSGVVLAGSVVVLGLSCLAFNAEDASGRTNFARSTLPFILENDETPAPNPPASMAGAVAMFDYNQTFPLLHNSGDGEFLEVTTPSGMRKQSLFMAGFGGGLFDFDKDGWKELFVIRGHVASLPQPGSLINQPNTEFRNLGLSGRWQASTAEAGLDSSPGARHRDGAFDHGDGRVDVVARALGRETEIWMNQSSRAAHWLHISLEGVKSNRNGIGALVKVVTKSNEQFDHMTSSVGYASSSLGPVHFGRGSEPEAESVIIHWPSGVTQRCRT